MIGTGNSVRSWARFRKVLACAILGGVLFWLGNCVICSYHVRVIQESGGDVYFDWGTNDSGFPRKPWVPLPIRQVVGDAVFARPHAVTFQNCRVSVAGVASIGSLGQIRRLFIGTAELEPGAMAAIAKARGLESLELNRLDVSKRELLSLGTMTQLRSLRLSQIVKCDDEVMSSFQDATQLESLVLAYVNVTSDGMRRFRLSEKARLRHVSFDSVPVDGRVLEMLDDLPNLRSLSVFGTEISDDEISAFFQRHPEIRGAPNSAGDIILKIK